MEGTERSTSLRSPDFQGEWTEHFSSFSRLVWEFYKHFSKKKGTMKIDFQNSNFGRLHLKLTQLPKKIPFKKKKTTQENRFALYFTISLLMWEGHTDTI